MPDPHFYEGQQWPPPRKERGFSMVLLKRRDLPLLGDPCPECGTVMVRRGEGMTAHHRCPKGCVVTL